MGSTGIKATVSIRYDESQDRIRLLFSLKNKVEVEGVLTRGLFKRLLQSAPDWLAANPPLARAAESAMSSNALDMGAGQPAVDYPLYQPVTLKSQKRDETSKNIESFMIGTITMKSLLMAGDEQGVGLGLGSIDKPQALKLTLTVDQFLMLIGIMTDKAANWDLVNPWFNTSFFAAIGLRGGEKIVH